MNNQLKIWSLLIFLNSGFVLSQSIVVFSKTEGYRHESIEAGIASIKQLGVQNNFQVEATEDANTLMEYLKKSKVVIFLNTTGNIFTDSQKNIFNNFIVNGGGFVGIHAATDTEYDWAWYGKMIGAYFKSHPNQQIAALEVIDKQHLSTNFLNQTWQKFDEWYNFKEINPNIKVLMRLDESSYIGGENGKNHPIAWYHEYQGGRIFYTGLGHTKESYSDVTFLKHILGGIKYTLGQSN